MRQREKRRKEKQLITRSVAKILFCRGQVMFPDCCLCCSQTNTSPAAVITGMNMTEPNIVNYLYRRSKGLDTRLDFACTMVVDITFFY